MKATKAGKVPAGQEKQVVTAEEAIKTVMYVQEALINILEREGITNRSEIMQEIKAIQAAKHSRN